MVPCHDSKCGCQVFYNPCTWINVHLHHFNIIMYMNNILLWCKPFLYMNICIVDIFYWHFICLPQKPMEPTKQPIYHIKNISSAFISAPLMYHTGHVSDDKEVIVTNKKWYSNASCIYKREIKAFQKGGYGQQRTWSSLTVNGQNKDEWFGKVVP